MINLHVQAADVAELHAKLAGMLAGRGTEAAATAPASSPKRGRSAKNSTSQEAAGEQKVPQDFDDNAATQNESMRHDTTGPDPVSVREPTDEPTRPLELAATAERPLTTPTTATEAAPARDEVIAALNVYSAPRGGQVAGRTKMQEVCGVNRLQDIKPEDYGKLIAALKAAEAK